MLSKLVLRAGAMPRRAQPMVFPIWRTRVRPAAASRIRRTSREPRKRRDCAVCARRSAQLEAAAGAANAARPSKRAGDRANSRRAPSLQPVLERLNASIAEIVGMRPDLRRRAERDVVQLALLIAQRVLHRELSVDEKRSDRHRARRLRAPHPLRVLQVTVHPQFRRRRRVALPGSQAARVQIEPDPDCAPGTLIIHSAEGIDRRFRRRATRRNQPRPDRPAGQHVN